MEKKHAFDSDVIHFSTCDDCFCGENVKHLKSASERVCQLFCSLRENLLSVCRVLVIKTIDKINFFAKQYRSTEKSIWKIEIEVNGSNNELKWNKNHRLQFTHKILKVLHLRQRMININNTHSSIKDRLKEFTPSVKGSKSSQVSQ